LVEQLRSQVDVLYVDVGGAPGGASAYDQAKFEAILEGELTMHVAAHNIGLSEARLGAAYLRELRERLSVPWLSCNVREATGALIAEPLRVVRAAGRRIAFVGVLSDRTRIAGLEIDPPREAILETVRQASEPHDALIVLAYLSEEELHELAASLPEADVVVGGPTVQSLAPQHVGPTLLTSATNKGKFVARLNAPRGSSERWQGELIELTGQFADHVDQEENLDRFYHSLAERDFRPGDTSFVAPLPADVLGSFRIAGNERCRECHEDDCRLWKESKHAVAWESLAAKGAHVDAYCQQCHTTGYGLPGGFESARRSRSLGAVGCESCHGPSLAHAQHEETPTAFVGQADSQCVRCHDRENSPDFAYDKYWAKIEHGDTSIKQEVGT
jgi:hypothetical protein